MNSPLTNSLRHRSCVVPVPWPRLRLRPVGWQLLRERRRLHRGGQPRLDGGRDHGDRPVRRRRRRLAPDDVHLTALGRVEHQTDTRLNLRTDHVRPTLVAAKTRLRALRARVLGARDDALCARPPAAAKRPALGGMDCGEWRRWSLDEEKRGGRVSHGAECNHDAMMYSVCTEGVVVVRSCSAVDIGLEWGSEDRGGGGKAKCFAGILEYLGTCFWLDFGAMVSWLSVKEIFFDEHLLCFGFWTGSSSGLS